MHLWQVTTNHFGQQVTCDGCGRIFGNNEKWFWNKYDGKDACMTCYDDLRACPQRPIF